jgi:hypothetical protein
MVPEVDVIHQISRDITVKTSSGEQKIRSVMYFSAATMAVWLTEIVTLAFQGTSPLLRYPHEII